MNPISKRTELGKLGKWQSYPLWDKYVTIAESQTEHTLHCQPYAESMVLTAQRGGKYMRSISDDVVFTMC